MKLIEILLTEVFDNPYPLEVQFEDLEHSPRIYTSKFVTDSKYEIEVLLNEDYYSIDKTPTFNLGFKVAVDADTQEPVSVDDFEDGEDSDGIPITINKKTGNQVRFTYSKRINNRKEVFRVLASIIQHVKKFKKLADEKYKGYAIIFTPAKEFVKGINGEREEIEGSAEKLGNMYESMINHIKDSDDFKNVEFIKSTKGFHQANFKEYKGQYLHKHPVTKIKKVDRAISKIEDKIDDTLIDPIANKIIEK